MLFVVSAACFEPHALIGFQSQRPLCAECPAGDLIGEVVACPIRPQLVGIHFLRMLGKICHDHESLATMTDIAEEMPIAGLNELSDAIVGSCLLLPQLDQMYQPCKDAAGRAP